MLLQTLAVNVRPEDIFEQLSDPVTADFPISVPGLARRPSQASGFLRANIHDQRTGCFGQPISVP